MAESALRYLDQMYMMGIGQGPTAPRPQRTRGQEYADMLGAASLPLSGVPIAGDIAGFAADAAMYAAYPEERTMGNYAMSALGGLPLIPGAAALRAARSDPIDMSTEARMQRGADQGFLPQTVYHGTRQDIPEFNVAGQIQNRKTDAPAGVYFFSSSPETAGSYTGSGRSRAGAANIIPAKVRLQNPFVIDAANHGWSQMPVPHSVLSEIDPINYPPSQNIGLDGTPRMLYISTNDLSRKVAASGKHDGLLIKNVWDSGNLKAKNVSDVYAVFDPSNIRSVNAAFDPANRGSSNLLATAAGGTISLSALRQLMPQEEERPIE